MIPDGDKRGPVGQRLSLARSIGRFRAVRAHPVRA